MALDLLIEIGINSCGQSLIPGTCLTDEHRDEEQVDRYVDYGRRDVQEPIGTHWKESEEEEDEDESSPVGLHFRSQELYTTRKVSNDINLSGNGGQNVAKSGADRSQEAAQRET